jgi:hypothetical protein
VSEAAIASDCRYQLTGVWSDQRAPHLDSQLNVRGFVDATYAGPDLRYIEMLDDGQTLRISPLLGDGPTVTVRAADATPLAEVLAPGGPEKAYLLPGQAVPERGRSVFVDVSQSNRIRIRLGPRSFYRPEGVPMQGSAIDSEFRSDSGLAYLSAMDKGYDLIAQNPFDLLDNRKQAIFGRADLRLYRVVDRKNIPLGLRLIPQSNQITITTSEMISSQSEYQRTVATSFGARVGFEGTAGRRGSNGEGTPVSAGIGAGFAQSQTQGMMTESRDSIALGHARHSLYALVRDHAFVTLSDGFIDDLDDLRRDGDYRRFIAKYGTHYPYALTYGSAAWMESHVSQKQVASWMSQSKDVNVQAGLQIAGFGASFNAGRFEEDQSRQGSGIETTRKLFKAVGGTGGWDERSYGTGDPAPFLADMRPIPELLNPANFPDDPEITERVRYELADAIEAYLARAPRLSDLSTLPTEVVPGDRRERWQVTVESVTCLPNAHFGEGSLARIYGTFQFVGIRNGRAEQRVRPFNVQGGQHWNINCSTNSARNTRPLKAPNAIVLEGSLEEARAFRFKFGSTLGVNGKWFVYNQEGGEYGFAAAAPDKAAVYIYTIDPKLAPGPKLRIRTVMRRISE